MGSDSDGTDTELWSRRAPSSGRKSDAHGCKRPIDFQVSVRVFLTSSAQAFYNPNSSGGIERTGRARDVGADTARFPFEVS